MRTADGARTGAGDAIGLYRIADDALVDGKVQLGNDQADPTRWRTTLEVAERLETSAGPAAEATTPGAYELRLYCEIGSSMRGPAFLASASALPEDLALFAETAATASFTVTGSDALDGGGRPEPADGRRSEREDPVPGLTRSIASPRDVDWDVGRLVTNALLALALVVLLPFPAALFNSTFEANYDEIRSWLPFRRRAAGRGRHRVFAFAALVIMSAALNAFLDPTFGLDKASGVLVAGLTLSIAATSGLAIVPAALHHRRGDRARAEVRLYPLALVVAAVCVLASRVGGFEPGYLYGLVAGVSFGAAVGRAEALEELDSDEVIEAFVQAGMEQVGPVVRYPNEEHLTDEERASLDGCVVGSTRAEVAARLRDNMVIWKDEATSEEIAAHYHPEDSTPTD